MTSLSHFFRSNGVKAASSHSSAIEIGALTTILCSYMYDIIILYSGSYINCHNELQEIPTLLLFYSPSRIIIFVFIQTRRNHVASEKMNRNATGKRGGMNLKR